MIILLILLALLIGSTIWFVYDCRKDISELNSVFSMISTTVIALVNAISFIAILGSFLNNASLEKRLNNQYETLIKNIDNPYAISDIIKYNEEVINGKYYLSNPWTNWYIESAYEDAKVIEFNNNNPMIQH